MPVGMSVTYWALRLVPLLLITVIICTPVGAFATPLLDSTLAGFAVLGASTVTNIGATTIIGNVGVNPGSAITGAGTISITGTYHTGADPVGILAQSQLVTAMTGLASLGVGTLEPADLVGLTLAPGVYTVPAGVSNLTGTLTLDGGGNANAAWVFQLPSSLITSPGAVVNVINTGANAGIFWNVGSSATLDTTTSFLGNILVLSSITLNHGATIACGRALAHTGAVTMDNNTIGATGCTGTGYGGGLDVSSNGTVTVLASSVTETPEPASVAVLSGALVLLAFMLQRARFAAPV